MNAVKSLILSGLWEAGFPFPADSLSWFCFRQFERRNGVIFHVGLCESMGNQVKQQVMEESGGHVY